MLGVNEAVQVLDPALAVAGERSIAAAENAANAVNLRVFRVFISHLLCVVIGRTFSCLRAMFNGLHLACG